MTNAATPKLVLGNWFTDVTSEERAMLKMYTKDNKWIVIDGARNLEFDNATDAWVYVFMMRCIRPNAPKAPESLHPVKSLVPSTNTKEIILTVN